MNPDDVPRILDRYELLAFLGEGNLGPTYLVADHAREERRLALKLLPTERLARVPPAELEAGFSAWIRLHHPNLAEGYEYARVEGTGMAAFALEYVPGETFFGATSGERLEPLVRWTRQACAGLGHLHAAGFLHGNLKPENVRVTPGDEGRAVLLDPCLAAWMAPARGSRRMRRQLWYTAPEVLLNHPPTVASDFYSLGVLLFEAATRRLPFLADDALTLMRQHISADVHDPRTINPRLPAGLARLIQRLLSKTPADRPARAEDVAEALERAGTLPRTETRRVQRAFVPWGRMVGREAALAELRRHLDHQCGGLPGRVGPPILLFQAEAGGGKTRLLREARSQAQVSGVSYLAARCPEVAPAPFEPVIDLVEQWTALAEDLVDAPARARIDAGFGELREALSATGEPSAARGLSAAERLADLWLEAGLALPVLLVLDDLHRADEGTLAFLRELAVRLAATVEPAARPRLAVIAAARPGVGAGPSAWTRRGRREGLLAVRALPPLGADDVRALARSMAGTQGEDAAVALGLAERCNGNPLFVEECLRERLEEGAPGAAASLEEVLLRRWAGAGEPARDAAAWLATHARPISASLLAAVQGGTIDAAQAALDEGERRRLFVAERNRGPHGVYRFHHEIAAEAAYRGLPPADRATRHRRLAAALRLAHAEGGMPPVPDLVAHHALAGGEPGSARASLVEAARRARALGRPEDAADRLTRALALAGEACEDDELRLEALDAWLEAGQAQRAMDEIDRLLASAPAGSRLRAGLWSRRGTACAQRGDGNEANAGWLAARKEAERSGHPAALAEALPAATACAVGETVDAAFSRAWTAAHASGGSAGFAPLDRALAARLAGDGDEGRAQAVLRRGIALARRDRRSVEVCRLLAELGESLAREGRLTEAADHLRGAIEIGVQLGGPEPLQGLLSLGRVELERGDMEAARTSTEAALARATGRGDRMGRGRALILLGRAATGAGDLSTALESLQEALHMARGLDGRGLEPEARRAWGRLCLAAGERDLARAAAHEGLKRAGDGNSSAEGWAAHDLLGRIARVADGPAAAVAWFEKALAAAAALRRPALAADTLGQWAMAQADAGQVDAVLAIRARAAVLLPDRSPALPLAAGFDFAVARALLRTGRAAEAREFLDRAGARPGLALDLRWRLLAERARCSLSLARAADAAAQFRAAFEILHRTWSALPDRWRATWLDEPEKRELRADARSALE